MNDNEDGGGGGGGGAIGDESRRSVRHHGKHHGKNMAPPSRWPTADERPDATAHHRWHHDDAAAQLLAANRSDALRTAAGTAATPQPPQPPHVLLHAAPASMCYTTNEVLVIIAVTCFLNFAFILLIMTCVHCFTDPSHHKKFGAVAYAELGDELFDSDMIDGDAVTLLNPTKNAQECYRQLPYNKNKTSEYDLEACAAPPPPSFHQSLHRDRRCKSLRKSEEDLLLFE